MTAKIKALATALTLCTAFSTFSATAAVDAKLPDYQRASGISGNLTSIGSDTLANLMTLWAQEFKKELSQRQCADPSRWFFNSAASLGGRHSQYGADVTDDERQ